MPDTSPRLALPLLASGQAQKEVTHNEALTLVDGLLHGTIQSRTLAVPPSSPAPGQLWLVAANGSGSWAGHDGELALWTGGGWRFMAAVQGMCLYSIADQAMLSFDGSSWLAGGWPVTTIRIGGKRVVAARQGAIGDPAGGTTIDTQARATLAALLAALRAHGLIET